MMIRVRSKSDPSRSLRAKKRSNLFGLPFSLSLQTKVPSAQSGSNSFRFANNETVESLIRAPTRSLNRVGRLIGHGRPNILWPFELFCCANVIRNYWKLLERLSSILIWNRQAKVLDSNFEGLQAAHNDLQAINQSFCHPKKRDF